MTTKELLKSMEKEEGLSMLNSKMKDSEVYDLLVSKGLTDSFETFVLEAKKLAEEQISKMSKDELLEQLNSSELLEEELKLVAGGTSDDFGKGFIVGITAGAILTGGVCAAAAAAA